MRLNQVTVTDYRCINDSGPVEVGDVTCLVGKNESGKTAFLQRASASSTRSRVPAPTTT